jgi:cyclopropane-fatty-acyl-phospholipid synthase
MTNRYAETALATASIRKISWLDAVCRDLLARTLRGIREGEITVSDGGWAGTFGRTTPEFPVRAAVTVHDPSFYRRAVLGGSVGAGESYADGAWTCDDLVSLVRIMARNEEALSGMESGAARFLGWAYRAAHGLRRNSRAGSRRNVAEHYDLGNDFYRLFLDPTMAYSCAIFERADATLEEASVAKFDRIARKLRLSPAHRVLEVGCGWGGFALHAASNYGCRVVGITVSRAQHEEATRRVAEAGLSDRVEIRLQDYRDAEGTFDRVVSIEMIEAVGAGYLPTFMKACTDRLAPDGLMLLQAITIRDDLYDRHVRTVDFIKRHIFPGTFIPSVTAIATAAAKGTDLRLVHLEDITPHYAETLKMWRERFRTRLNEVRSQGFPDRFARTWEYYLSYCEGSFRERYNGDVQMIFSRPRWREAPVLPPLPAN